MGKHWFFANKKPKITGNWTNSHPATSNQPPQGPDCMIPVQPPKLLGPRCKYVAPVSVDPTPGVLMVTQGGAQIRPDDT